jgi:hypothetical protein
MVIQQKKLNLGTFNRRNRVAAPTTGSLAAQQTFCFQEPLTEAVSLCKIG